MRKNNQGNTLVVVLVLLAALVGLVGAAVQYTQEVARRSQRERANVSAQGVGDACFELMYSEWRQICRRDAQTMPSEPYSYVDGTNGTTAYTTPYAYKYSRLSPPPTSSFNSVQLPTSAMFPNVTNFTVTRGAVSAAPAAPEVISNYKIQAIEPTFALTTSDPPLSTIPTGQRPPGGSGENFYPPERMGQNKSWYYLASADVTLPSPGALPPTGSNISAGYITTKMRRIFEKREVHPWNYLMFFNDDLELHPASTSPFTLYGQVHTNGTLYTGTSYLTFNSVVPKLTGPTGTGGQDIGGPQGATGPAKTRGVSYGDAWTIGFKTGDAFHSGSGIAPTVAANTPVQRAPKLIPYDWDTTQWTGVANSNSSDAHEIIEVPLTPLSTYPDPLSPLVGDTWDSIYGTTGGTGGKHACSGWYANERYYSRCGVRITITAPAPNSDYSAANQPTVTIQNANVPPDTLNTNPGPAGPESAATTDPWYYGYRWVHDFWKASLGVGATSGAAPTPTPFPAKIGIGYKNNTIGSITSGAATLTTTTAGFFASTDLGRIVKVRNAAGTSIVPAGTFIKGYTSGTSVTLSQNASSTVSGAANITMEGIVTITDNREGKQVDLITIDFHQFDEWDPHTTNPGYTCPDNGAQGALRQQTAGIGGECELFNVYVDVVQNTTAGSHLRAIRFKNCGACSYTNQDPCNTNQRLLTSGWPCVLFVTDAPLYIQGDYNTGRVTNTFSGNTANSATQPPSNFNAGPRTTVFENSDTYLVPDGSVIAADSVTLLSNAWNDANSGSALSSRIASNTTVNARIMTGDVPTSATNGYSGGGENLLRLMEDWTGKYLTFSGSLVQFYHSKVATGTWGKANVYSEPAPSSGNGGRIFYQETFDSQFRPWGFEFMVGYYRHEWSPTP